MNKRIPWNNGLKERETRNKKQRQTNCFNGWVDRVDCGCRKADGGLRNGGMEEWNGVETP